MAPPEVSHRDNLQLLAIGVSWLLLLAGVTVAFPWPLTDWRTVLTLAGVVAVASYGLHRYEQVRLGLVQEDES